MTWPTHRSRLWLVALLAALLALASAIPLSRALAQENPREKKPGGGTIKINLRGEVPLAILLEYVSQRTKTRFLYDDALSQKKIHLQVPDEIPLEHLDGLLQSALQISGLALVETDDPASRRIVNLEKLAQVAVPVDAADGVVKGDAFPAIQLFVLRNADPAEIKTILTPFLTTPGANMIALPQRRAIIVTDIVANLRRVERLVKILDAEQAGAGIKFVRVRHVAADELAKRLQEIFEARSRTESVTTSATTTTAGKVASSLEVAADPRTSQLILIGVPSQIDAAVELLKALDVPLETTTRAYRLRFLSPKRVSEIVEQWLGGMNPRPPLDTRIEGDQVLVTTTDVMQRQIARLISQIDSQETSIRQNPIRFYKIKNVPVHDILQTLNSLQGGYGGGGFSGPAASGAVNRRGSSGRSRSAGDRAIPGQASAFPLGSALNVPGPGATPGGLRGAATDPYAATAPQQAGAPFNVGAPGGAGYPGQSYPGQGFPGTSYAPGAYAQGGYPPGYYPGGPYAGFNPGLTGFVPMAGFPLERGIQSPLGSAQVTADVGSNTLIIIAEPEVQQAYQQLIEFLDKRRPQVMIEARVVVIDTTDDYTIGVETSVGDRRGTNRAFAFSSYGLSTVNPATGALAITPGQGFNFTLVDPSTADMVIRALATHRRARVLSSPKILVDDNAEGVLESVNEVPFTSVNASQTVATTSFAGFAKAGTTIKVTPTISEGRHVNLDYIVTLNSFTGAGAAGVPPPRQTNEVGSRVTVPDGYTIIVGGLTQRNASNSENGFPFIEHVPWLRALTSLNIENYRDQSLFVFLRPVILKDDKFRDLRHLSKREACEANDGHDFPASEPVYMSP